MRGEPEIGRRCFAMQASKPQPKALQQQWPAHEQRQILSTAIWPPVQIVRSGEKKCSEDCQTSRSHQVSRQRFCLIVVYRASLTLNCGVSTGEASLDVTTLPTAKFCRESSKKNMENLQTKRRCLCKVKKAIIAKR